MLRIGLTGGIGAGKSTVATILAAAGAAVIDADAIAREVVEPGRPALAKLVEIFGTDILTPERALDRAELARLAFASEESTAALNAVMHPAIAKHTAEAYAAHADRQIVVHDVPLLVENDLSPNYHLALLVDVPAETRLHRLVEFRGMDRQDAATRIQLQASDAERHAACDVRIDNTGSQAETAATVEELVRDRLLPYAENLRTGTCAPRGGPILVDPESRDWEAAAERIVARLNRALQQAGRPDDITIEHIGSTAVPGMPAKDVIDLQVTVEDLAQADDIASVLAGAGYPARTGDWWDTVPEHVTGSGREDKRLHQNADPGQAVNIHVRPRANWSSRFAPRFRDLLCTNRSEFERYRAMKTELAATHADDTDGLAYAEAKEPYFAELVDRLGR